jgi:hypothetical protein
MLSIIAIVIAGFSLTCLVITVYRNLPEPIEIVRKSDHGILPTPTNILTGANGPAQELVVCDPELNLQL